MERGINCTEDGNKIYVFPQSVNLHANMDGGSVNVSENIKVGVSA